jgi:hypothetical protein
MGEVDKIKDSTSKVGECLIHVTIKDEVPVRTAAGDMETAAQPHG